jgi:hypothetical protein
MGRPAARIEDLTEKGGKITGTQKPHVIIGDDGSSGGGGGGADAADGTMLPTFANAYASEKIEGQYSQVAHETHYQTAANGAPANLDVNGSTPAAGTVDTSAANTKNGTPYTGNFGSYTQTEYPKTDPIYSTLMLTPNTPLSEFTTKTALWNNGPPGNSGKWLKAQTCQRTPGPVISVTVPQILNNLANLAKNTYEPIKAKYPNVFMTNSFRQGSGEAQHGTGQACDLQFRGAAFKDYYDIAVWIRDNVPFNQLLIEYGKRASGPFCWIHVAYWDGTGNGYGCPSMNKVGSIDTTVQKGWTTGLKQYF